jgi:hypothetical protein
MNKGNNFKTKSPQDFLEIKRECLSAEYNYGVNDLWKPGMYILNSYNLSSGCNTIENESKLRHIASTISLLMEGLLKTSVVDYLNVKIHASYYFTQKDKNSEPLLYVWVSCDKEHRAFFFGKGCINLNILRTTTARLAAINEVKLYIEFEDGTNACKL